MSATAASDFRAVATRRGPLVAWLLALAGGIAAMLWLGQGHLATPPLTDLDAWSTWLARRDPLVAAMAVFRLLVLAIAWYLVGVTAVSLIAHVARAASLVRLADTLSIPVVRRVTQQAVGIALATAAVATVSHAPSPADLSPPVAAGTEISVAHRDQTVAMRALAPQRLAMRSEAGASEGAGETLAMRPTADAGHAAMRRVEDAYTARMQRLTGGADRPDASTDGPGEVTRAAAAEPPSADVTARGPGEAGDAATVEVAPGDHLWSIAERTLTAAWDRAPTDAEVEPYWRDLIEENRGRLSNPDDPDLLLPGQVLRLPAPPPVP